MSAGPLAVLLWPAIFVWMSSGLSRVIGDPSVPIPDPSKWLGEEALLGHPGDWALPLVPVASAVISIPATSVVYTYLVDGSLRDLLNINRYFFLNGLFLVGGSFVATGGMGFIWSVPVLWFYIIGGVRTVLLTSVWLASGGLMLLGAIIWYVQERLADRWDIRAFRWRAMTSLRRS